MPEELLQGRQRDALLDRGDGEGVAQHMGGHRPAHTCAARDTLDQQLNGAGCQAYGVLECEVVLEERLEAGRDRDDAPLGVAAVRTALAIVP
jgi:hypothetical protein